MTEKRFNEIVARQQQPVFGIPSQARTDIAELISEIGRRGPEGFEPEPSDEAPEPAHHDRANAKATSGARKK
jgi:hypothetical protein